MNSVRIALSSPIIRLCDTEYNVKLHIDAAKEAAEAGADILAFPELSLTGATCGHLYRQRALTLGATLALMNYVKETRDLPLISFVGAPLCIEGKVYNAYVAISGGKVIGITASDKVCPEFDIIQGEPIKFTLGMHEVCIGNTLAFSDEASGARIFSEIGEREEVSPAAALYDANIYINPTAVAEYITLANKRRAAVMSKYPSGVYLYVGAGEGESGTDGVYAGPRLICASSEIVAEAKLFSPELLMADIDLSKLGKGKRVKREKEEIVKYPFIPTDKEEREEALTLALDLQAKALALRLERSYSRTCVIGVSGGLDSTLALLVAARCMDILSLDRKNIIAITMPCFGTTERTKSNALALAEELGATVRTIDIKAAVTQHFADISHDEGVYNVVYENAQARERTQILMDIANATSGLVVGTGDLSELALGFATYNGDHMSMYAVNASVPKTLMRAMIRQFADEAKKVGRDRVSEVLYDVVNTPVSPELLPSDNGETNAQHTEDIVGPYELHDFFLYYMLRDGYTPRKLLEIANELFASDYNEELIFKTLETFTRRFLTQQFKRSCLPDGPRVTEISLSPRGFFNMPSDVSINLWKKYFLEG